MVDAAQKLADTESVVTASCAKLPKDNRGFATVIVIKEASKPVDGEKLQINAVPRKNVIKKGISRL